MRTTTIHSLPTELVQIIHSELPPEDGRRFRLTCWNLRNKTVAGPWTRADQKRWALARQKHWPNGVLCHNCYYFHPFGLTDKSFPPDQYVHQPHLECGNTQGSVKLGTRWLKFSHVQLLMNRRRWGKEHGLPLDALSKPYELSPPACLERPDQFRLRQKWQPKIIRGQLYLKGEYVLCGHMPDLVLSLDSLFPIQLCQHRVTEFGVISLLCRRITEPITNPSAWPTEGNSRAFPLQCCDFCHTDYAVTLGYHPGNDRVRYVRFETWHLLGECATPGDRHWLAMSSMDVLKIMSFKVNNRSNFVCEQGGQVRWIYEMAEHF